MGDYRLAAGVQGCPKIVYWSKLEHNKQSLLIKKAKLTTIHTARPMNRSKVAGKYDVEFGMPLTA